MWIDYFSPHNELEYILSLDSDDANRYLPVIREMLGYPLKVVINQNKNVVQALNKGAEQATGDILVYVSDDFECIQNWDIRIQEAVKSRGDDWFLLVNDGIQKTVATIMFVSKKYYERFGYLYYPRYISMFADPDATEVAKRLGKLVDATYLLFRHNHRSIGGLPGDATSAKHENPAVWARGEKLFNERATRNFDV